MLQPIQQYNSMAAYRQNSPSQIPAPLATVQIPPAYTMPQIQMPQGNRNYVLVDPLKVDYFVKQKENALPYIENVLQNSNNEAEITESLYILDRMLDNGTKGIDKMYPELSRFNNTNSANIQTFLAGIYRKTQMPDAFGPLVAMLFRNSVNPPQSNFDPNEEVGGAILAYISDRFKNNSQEPIVTKF